MEEVEDKVKSIIAEQLGVDIASVTPEASFTEDLGADSLDAVELIMAIEEAFDIEIPDEEAESMTTPAECVTAIKAKLEAAAIASPRHAHAAWFLRVWLRPTPLASEQQGVPACAGYCCCCSMSELAFG
eukprot:CAMPEP_0119355320 /NCGR_PEP_ID=MMETSP1334-20130426/4162_1 /TAXON_ID=127549 /ORGANISM="Calcidiscus leptoporus, Strain RCC1130" /LENGTH=128 /DNA_ID=CAMNT_0007369113 /DNA_START=193 /DNA_END=580 /DNA_ORIENTATION=+